MKRVRTATAGPIPGGKLCARTSLRERLYVHHQCEGERPTARARAVGAPALLAHPRGGPTTGGGGGHCHPAPCGWATNGDVEAVGGEEGGRRRRPREGPAARGDVPHGGRCGRRAGARRAERRARMERR